MICGQAQSYCFWTIVPAFSQCGAVNVADPIRLGLTEIGVVYLTALAARQSTSQPFQQNILINPDINEKNRLSLLLGQCFKQVCLGKGPRVSVKHIAVATIILHRSGKQNLGENLVTDQVSGIHHLL